MVKIERIRFRTLGKRVEIFVHPKDYAIVKKRLKLTEKGWNK